MTVELVAVNDRLPTDRVVHRVQNCALLPPLSLSFCGGGTMGCGEAWKMPADGPAHVTAVFTYEKACALAWFALLWARHGHPSSVHRHQSFRNTLPGPPKPAPSDPSELSPLQTACGVGDHAGDACQAKPTIICIPPSNQTDHIRKLLPTWASSRMIVLAALTPTSDWEAADTSRSAHPGSPSRKLLIKL